MWGWFGGGAASQKKKDSAKNAILALRSQLDMLQKRERHIQNQIEEQEAIARKNVNTNKTGMYMKNCETFGCSGVVVLTGWKQWPRAPCGARRWQRAR